MMKMDWEIIRYILVELENCDTPNARLGTEQLTKYNKQ